jgi:cytochrome P450
LGINTSIGGAVAHDLHRRRREALNPFFSQRSIARLVPKLNEKIQQLEDRFSEAAKTNEVLNISDLYFGLASE